MTNGTSGIIDLSEALSRNYEKCYLKYNPFPAIGVSEGIPRFTIDREEIIKKFQYGVSELRKTDTSVLTMLIGQYGNGKSHMLLQFKENINRQLLNRNGGMLAAYVKSPGEEFRTVFVTMMDNITLNRIASLVLDYFKEIIEKDLTIQKFCKEPTLTKFKERTAEVGDLLNVSEFLNLTKEMNKKYFLNIPNPDLVNAFLCLAHPEYSPVAWKWFLGEKLSTGEQHNTGIKSPITNENSKKHFLDLIKILHVIGIKHLALFVDEIEKISDLHQTKKDRYHDDLRQIIDDNVKNVFFYFAITIKQWEKYTSISTALSRRLVINGVKLDDFTVEQTQKLVEQYLESARSENFTSKNARKDFPDCEPSLCPFTTNSIESLHNTTKGVIYKILHACRDALELAHDEPDKFSSVNDVILKKYKPN